MQQALPLDAVGQLPNILEEETTGQLTTVDAVQTALKFIGNASMNTCITRENVLKDLNANLEDTTLYSKTPSSETAYNTSPLVQGYHRSDIKSQK